MELMTRGKVIAEETRREFRSMIGGCIPDLMQADGGELESSPSEYRDSITDFVGDRSVDWFPDLEGEQREELKLWVTEYYCGPLSFPLENPNATEGRRGGK